MGPGKIKEWLEVLQRQHVIITIDGVHTTVHNKSSVSTNYLWHHIGEWYKSSCSYTAALPCQELSSEPRHNLCY